MVIRSIKKSLNHKMGLKFISSNEPVCNFLIFITMKVIIILTCLIAMGSLRTLDQNDQIKKAIQDLLVRTNFDAFLIIEDPKTKKYVQYATSEKDGLYFSLPTIMLSDEEIERARLVLGEYDIHLNHEHKGDRSYAMQEFAKSLGQDVDLATELVSRIMLEVYLFEPSIQLSLIEN